MPTRASMASRSPASAGAASSSGQRVAGGSGSSDSDSLKSEVGRLSQENAHLSRKISEMLGKAPATPVASRSGSGQIGAGSGERMREQLKKLERDNRRLADQNASLERRLASGKITATADDLWKVKEENRSLRSENSQLSSEIEQLNKVASYVGNRVAKVLVGARRANNYNSQLVGELKRWNRRLEEENHRLYNIIDRLQNTRPGSAMANAVASEASELSTFHDRGRDGNAALVKQLEDQNVKLQEEISKLSDHAISLQNLSSSSGSSGSSGILPAPRTPSNHEQDAPGLRRSLTPDQGKVAEKLRGVEAERRKSRNLSADSLTTATSEPADVERLRTENKKYAEEIERIGADLAFVRNQVTLSKELQDSNAQQVLQIEKLTEAAARVQALEESNAKQAVEIDRLLGAQAQLEEQAKAALHLREDNSQMEEDIFKLADEVERLQPFADKAAELESRLATYEQQLAEAHAAQDNSSSETIARLKEENVEVQRTLEALAAEKSVLQAQVRELLEERAQLQSEKKDLDQRIRGLQEKANESAALRTELAGLGQVRGQSAAYRAQISTLRNENEMLARKVSDLNHHITANDGSRAAMTALQGFSLMNSSFTRGRSLLDQTPELEALRAENSSLFAQLEDLRAQCQELSEREAAGKPGERGTSEHAGALEELASKEAELARLEEELAASQAECRDLSARAQGSVLMTVELTTLRNQVSDLQKLEVEYQEQQTALKQLRSEKAALQKEASAAAALKADIAALRTQVTKAEMAQKAAEAQLAAATSTASQAELAKQHEDRAVEIFTLQKQHSSVAAELDRRESELTSLQMRHEALVKEQGQQSNQSKRELEGAKSEMTALYTALKQERARADSISDEAAELHNLLQTAKTERSSQGQALDTLRAENEELMHRIAQLVAKNEEQEKTLASVLAARGQSNGHADGFARGYDDTEAGGTSMTPVKNPASTPDKPPGSRSARYTDSSDDGWRTPPSSPSARVASQVMLAPPTPLESKRPAPKNGKTSTRSGFGKLFRLGSRRSGSHEQTEEPKAVLNGVPAARTSPSLPSGPVFAPPAAAGLEGDANSEAMLAKLAEEQVLNMYERHVDSDNIDGFMSDLGYPGFQGPTAVEDMPGAFAAAKYACRPDSMVGASPWDRQMAMATYALLEAWHSAAFEEA